MARLEAIGSDTLRRLHPRAISDPSAVADLLDRIRVERTVLRGDVDRFGKGMRAEIAQIEAGTLLIEVRDCLIENDGAVLFHCEVGSQPYFFSAAVRSRLSDHLARIAIPLIVYEVDRRDRERRASRGGVHVFRKDVVLAQGELMDLSAGGVGIRMAGGPRLRRGERLELEVRIPGESAKHLYAQVRTTRTLSGGWRRVGLLTTDHVHGSRLRLRRIAESDFLPKRRPSSVARVSIRRPVRVLFPGPDGEQISGIVEGCGDARNAVAVVVPPAWGKTKETLLPLAATLVASFASAGVPLTVLRFDGTGKVGESSKGPSGGRSSQQRITFSQGIRDIESAIRFLCEHPELSPRNIVLVTFSIAAVEGRRAALLDQGRRLAGWISVVGTPDAQALTRTVSSGIDFFGGAERGVRFGSQEIQGQTLDVDLWTADALAHRLPFLEDARRDFGAIRLPVRWIYGKYDGWIDHSRVLDALSAGDTSRRVVIEIPAGHQLRTSDQALATFQLVAREVARLGLDRSIPVDLPDPRELSERLAAENRRLQESAPAQHPEDLRGFWKRYLLGKDGLPGMELVTATTAYDRLMEQQIDALQLSTRDRVLDLGSGLGKFSAALGKAGGSAEGLHVLQADCVLDVLVGSCRKGSGRSPTVLSFACDLSGQADRAIPLASTSVEKILMSLLLNYVAKPEHLLRDAYRVLRSGGRAVISCLRRDADTSRIFVDMSDEVRFKPTTNLEEHGDLSPALLSFASDVARLHELEEQGVFRFWDAPEIADMLKDAGFTNISMAPVFGEPPQAFLAIGFRI